MKTVFFLFIIFSLSACIYQGPGGVYEIEMYVSLGLATSFPTGYEAADLHELSEKYGGKQVYFSVEGIDAGFNDSVYAIQSSEFGWTGGSVDSSTQYANCILDISDNTMYLAGRYKFRIFIDYDNSGTLNSGDLVMLSYSILVDSDNNSDTASTEITSSQYGDNITYSSSDYSIIINDPLSTDSGVPWVVTHIYEGSFAVY